MRISEVMKAAISSFTPFDSTKIDDVVPEEPGRTSFPIVDATRRGDHSMVVIALATGNDVNQKDDHDRTALHFAAAQNLPTIVHSLLSAGASPNLADNDGYTPLHRAIDQQSISIVTALLSAGANAGAQIADGRTALEIAETSGNRMIAEILSNIRH